MSIVPLAFPPTTAQVTDWLAALFTVAENCCCVADGSHVFPGSFANRLTVAGLTVTVTGGPVSVTVAVPEAVGFDCDVAVMVTVGELGMIPGAV